MGGCVGGWVGGRLVRGREVDRCVGKREGGG